MEETSIDLAFANKKNIKGTLVKEVYYFVQFPKDAVDI